MANYGIPFETTTDELRAFRAVAGDTNYETVTAPAGHPEWTADYVYFSDLEAEAFIAQGNDSTMRAAGWAYLALAANAATTGASIRDYDLAVDTKNRAAELRAIAQWFFDQADSDDAGSEDAFLIVQTGERCDPWPPELAPWDLSRLCACGSTFCYCGGRIV